MKRFILMVLIGCIAITGCENGSKEGVNLVLLVLLIVMVLAILLL